MIYGRSIRQLAVIWMTALVLTGLIYWFEVMAPAFHELVIPFYWTILGVTLFLTWRWLRSRSPKDRRGTDRRKLFRRGEPVDPPQAREGDREVK